MRKSLSLLAFVLITPIALVCGALVYMDKVKRNKRV